MFIVVLPLRAIMFQILFLSIAIAVESFVLEKRLGLSRRVSLEYATSINLFSTIFGWLTFFFMEPFLPQLLRKELINFILFDNFVFPQSLPSTSIYFNIILLAILVFLLSFFIELFSLNLLIKLNNILKSNVSNKADFQSQITKVKVIEPNSLFLANAYSQSLILLLCFFIQIL
ncbi:filament integrity protein FraC [Aerosakkonema sp. BLCC-F183]|uniref:filament integrity protein FraC n=1 Tax=Aerosakkonema sp. BLCC-F183 TaxID=3342834 RepID=UPI0035B754D0